MIRAIKARFGDQRKEFDVIRRHVQPGDTVCDIGANKGSWCRNGRVVAFEPQPALAGYLATVCSTLNLSNVTIEAKGAYSRFDVRELSCRWTIRRAPSLNRSILANNDCKAIPIELVSLDDYFEKSERISLLKIDVEGAELEVLKGAHRIIRQQSPLLLFESENRHMQRGTVEDVLSYLKTLGCDGCFVCGDNLVPISQFDSSKHQKRDGEWFWKNTDYFNNFVFSRFTD